MNVPTITRKLCALIAVVLAGPLIAAAQNASAAAVKNPIEIAGTFTYVHTNAPPGGCGCFAMYGASGSGAYYYGPHFALLVDISFAHTGNDDNTAQALSFTSYHFGVRVPVPFKHTRFVPFGQALVGLTRESGQFVQASAGSQSDTQVSAAGGAGLDYRLTPHLTLRALQAEYLLTRFPNGSNGRQNNLRLESGLAVRF